jgi:hypothetical protein
MDELELRTDAEVDHILDVYCQDLGMTQVCLGPGYAQVYDHHDQPPIDWTAHDILPLARKLAARGLHITLVALPDCAPYFDGRAWDFGLIDRNLGPIYQQLHAEGLIGSVRLEWETCPANSQMCQGVQWLRGIFPPDVPIYYHNPPGHLSPGLSSEDEQGCWRAFLAAGGSGLDLQSDPPNSRPDALQAMLQSLWDMRRRATGTDGSPWGPPLLTNLGVPMVVRNAEYSAYAVTHGDLPWATAQEFGRQGMTVAGPGDDTALDGI